MNSDTREPEPQGFASGPGGIPNKPKDWLEELPGERSSPRSNLGGSFRIWHLILLVAGVAIYLWLVVQISAWIIPFSFLILVAAAVGSGVAIARQRSTQQDALLNILAIAAERGMPLEQTVEAFADQYRGKYHRRIVRLKELLAAGCPLPEALDRVPRVVARDAVLLAHVGYRTGRLPEALRMASTSRASHLPVWTAIASRFAYLLALLLALQSIAAFLLFFIVPKFEAIFKDFGVPLPGVTTFVISASHFIVQFGLLTGWIPVVELLLLCFLPFSFAGWVNYDVPIFDRLLSGRHAALILRSLSQCVQAGQPIEMGMEILAQHYPTLWVRRLLIRAAEEAQHGGSWIEALHRRKLIHTAEADVLQTAGTVGNLAWAMLELADTRERRLAFRFQAVIQTLFPVVVVCLGACVLLFVVAFFAPLVTVIGRLAG